MLLYFSYHLKIHNPLANFMYTYSHTLMASLFPGSATMTGPLAPFFAGGIILLLIWSLVWKGFALWYAARNHQKAWYIVLLVLNTAGILEILYIAFFRKNKNDVVHTTTVTHTVTASTPGPDMASSDVPPAIS
jgi:hypothetical protein